MYNRTFAFLFKIVRDGNNDIYYYCSVTYDFSKKLYTRQNKPNKTKLNINPFRTKSLKSVGEVVNWKY